MQNVGSIQELPTLLEIRYALQAIYLSIMCVYICLHVYLHIYIYIYIYVYTPDRIGGMRVYTAIGTDPISAALVGQISTEFRWPVGTSTRDGTQCN